MMSENKKVLIVDADLKRCGLTDLFEVSRENPGLSTFLEQDLRKIPIFKLNGFTNNPNINSDKIVDMKVRLETSRQILYKVAWLKKNQGQAVMDAAIAKLYLSEAWVKSCLDAVQIHGGYGFTTEYELERDLRDSIGGILYSGTSEIQRNIIAHQLGL